ncbi:MAG: methyl-accepting chemotaxis protein [Hahellaceae bacterium]|nr:methyl-accepting chemotaxis protein [Hahellaceae bacterium]MCP5168921.1 methyl-accepting chemotaxis protein [Hahellaceae bacterium]
MKIATLTRLNSVLLILLALGLGGASWLGVQSLKSPLEKMDTISALEARINQGVVQVIGHYLGSGNALQLAEAEAEIDTLLEDPSLSAGELMRQALVEFKAFLATEARAAGKLSGNEMALLFQNERDTRDELGRLYDYSEAATEAQFALAGQYRKLILNLLMQMQDRSLATQQYLVNQQHNLVNQQHDLVSQQRALQVRDAGTAVSTLNDAMLNVLDELASLPRLGIMMQAETDEFALMLGRSDEAPALEKADDILANLQSLIQRYPLEVANTLKMKARLKSSHDRIARFVSLIEAGNASARSEVNQHFDHVIGTMERGMVIVLVLLVLFSMVVDIVQRKVAKGIRELVPFLSVYAKGDLREAVNMQARTVEFKALRDSANTLRDNLADLILKIKFKSGLVVQEGQQVQAASEEVNQKMVQQLYETTQIMTAMSQMTSSFNEVAERAADAAISASDADQATSHGLILLDESVAEVESLARQVDITGHAIRELAARAGNIGAVLEVIKSIAEQTNLLALNAAIEAARAGEYGRGFAVVADEVRTLSMKTAQSTTEIRTIIESIQSVTARCVDSVEVQSVLAGATQQKSRQASLAFADIGRAVSSIRDVTTQIATTTEEQAAVAQDIHSNVQRINHICEMTRNSSTETARKSLRLQEESAELQGAISLFLTA